MLDQYFDYKKKESEIYKKWEEADCFNIDNSQNPNGDIFNITMPPPNANGEMHIGHCYGHTIMDIMARYHRLRGDRVMLVPGKDHAGIQTQVVYERKLREEGVEVDSMPRDEFFKSCYDFCIDRASYMRGQEKEIGTSADFGREIFTLEPGVSDVVMDTFFRMWRDGLIYRGSRIVHWSVYSQTSISDVEVEYKEQKGYFWHIKYPLVENVPAPKRKRVKLGEIKGASSLIQNEENHFVVTVPSLDPEHLKIGELLVDTAEDDGIKIERDFVVWRIHSLPGADTKSEDLEKYDQSIREKILEHKGELVLVDLVSALDDDKNIVVATTRPETMLGDSAIAVHPADPRYLHLVGKKVKIPIAGREIDIVADDRVDIAFGTGAVKVTPAHDFLDYEIGNDHNLEQIQVIDKFGKMTAAAGAAYAGMSVEACRARLVEDLDKEGVLLVTEEITHKVPIAERGKDIIEPLISTQWFINVDKEGLSLKKRALELVNSGRLTVYPARLKDQIVQWLENFQDWNISRQILWGHRMPIWYRNKDTQNEEIYVGKEAPEGSDWEQETDTFDTWFSSGQWPYSTLSSLGFLDLNNPSKSEHFPTHTMLMGRDILLFWACRMLIFSAYRFNDVPWRNVYFTGLIRDEKGQKMSKSKGNGVEPKEMLNKYGADPLRAGLVIGSTAGQDVRFNEKKVDSYSKYLNKIWNAAKLIALKGEGDYQLKILEYSALKLDSSRWILGQLKEVQGMYRQKMDNYEFSAGLELIYHFSWDYFCSWYLEIAKIELETASEFTEEIKSTMFHAFKGILQMIHPFMPFFTEEIYNDMERFGGDNLLAASQFVTINGFDDKAFGESRLEIKKVIDVVSAAREFRKTLSKSFKDAMLVSPDFSMSQGMIQLAQKIAGIELLDIADRTCVIKPFSSGNILIEATEEEKKSFKDSLERALSKKQTELQMLEKMLTPGFKQNADPELVAERESQYNHISQEVQTLQNEISQN